MIAALFILFGYVSLVWTFEWIGLLAVAVHAGIMLLALGDGQKNKRPRV